MLPGVMNGRGGRHLDLPSARAAELAATTDSAAGPGVLTAAGGGIELRVLALVEGDLQQAVLLERR